MRRSPFRRAFAFWLAAAMVCLAGGQASAGSVVVEAERLVDTDTLIPGGPFEPGTPSTFSEIASGPVTGARLVFWGRVFDDSIPKGQGLYSLDLNAGAPETVVDTRDCVGTPCTPFSHGVGNFLNFSFDGTTVGFEATWLGFRDSVWDGTRTSPRRASSRCCLPGSGRGNAHRDERTSWRSTRPGGGCCG